MLNHVYMCTKIPPKYAVSSIVGFIKGKSTIMITTTDCAKTTSCSSI
jgi:putative transposase